MESQNCNYEIQFILMCINSESLVEILKFTACVTVTIEELQVLITLIVVIGARCGILFFCFF